jgi:hypothetical protein
MVKHIKKIVSKESKKVKVVGRSDCIVPKVVKKKTVFPCDCFVSCQECIDDRVNVGSEPKIMFIHK